MILDKLKNIFFRNQASLRHSLPNIYIFSSYFIFLFGLFDFATSDTCCLFSRGLVNRNSTSAFIFFLLTLHSSPSACRYLTFVKNKMKTQTNFKKVINNTRHWLEDKGSRLCSLFTARHKQNSPKVFRHRRRSLHNLQLSSQLPSLTDQTSDSSACDQRMWKCICICIMLSGNILLAGRCLFNSCVPVRSLPKRWCKEDSFQGSSKSY